MSRKQNAQRFVRAVGAKVRDERKARQLTQEQLADRLRSWVPQVSLLESGKRNIRISDLYLVALALETTPAVLVDVELPNGKGR